MSVYRLPVIIVIIILSSTAVFVEKTDLLRMGTGAQHNYEDSNANLKRLQKGEPRVLDETIHFSPISTWIRRSRRRYLDVGRSWKQMHTSRAQHGLYGIPLPPATAGRMREKEGKKKRKDTI